MTLSPGRLRHQRGRSNTEHLSQRHHNHHKIAGHTDRSDGFFSEVSEPIEISQQVQGLHQHARSQKRRHVQQVLGD